MLRSQLRPLLPKLQTLSEPLKILVLGDGPLLPAMVSAVCREFENEGQQEKEAAKRKLRVVSVQDSAASPSSAWVEAALPELSDSVVYHHSRQYLKQLPNNTSAEINNSEPINGNNLPPLIVVSEPFFSDLEGLLPWSHSLRLWSRMQTLR